MFIVTVTYNKGLSDTPPIKVKFAEDDTARMNDWIAGVQRRSRAGRFGRRPVRKTITVTHPDGTSQEIK